MFHFTVDASRTLKAKDAYPSSMTGEIQVYSTKNSQQAMG